MLFRNISSSVFLFTLYELRNCVPILAFKLLSHLKTIFYIDLLSFEVPLMKSVIKSLGLGLAMMTAWSSLPSFAMTQSLVEGSSFQLRGEQGKSPSHGVIDSIEGSVALPEGYEPINGDVQADYVVFSCNEQHNNLCGFPQLDVMEPAQKLSGFVLMYSMNVDHVFGGYQTNHGKVDIQNLKVSYDENNHSLNYTFDIVVTGDLYYTPYRALDWQIVLNGQKVSLNQ